MWSVRLPLPPRCSPSFACALIPLVHSLCSGTAGTGRGARCAHSLALTEIPSVLRADEAAAAGAKVGLGVGEQWCFSSVFAPGGFLELTKVFGEFMLGVTEI